MALKGLTIYYISESVTYAGLREHELFVVYVISVEMTREDLKMCFIDSAKELVG